MKKPKTGLDAFLPKTPKQSKSIYCMVRFDKHMELLDHVQSRVADLRTNKNEYILALIKQDKAVCDDKD